MRLPREERDYACPICGYDRPKCIVIGPVNHAPVGCDFCVTAVTPEEFYKEEER